MKKVENILKQIEESDYSQEQKYNLEKSALKRCADYTKYLSIV